MFSGTQRGARVLWVDAKPLRTTFDPICSSQSDSHGLRPYFIHMQAVPNRQYGFSVCRRAPA